MHRVVIKAKSSEDRALPESGSGTSHAEALKSTSIMGGSTAVVMLIRVIRTKVLALYLGPAGVGLEALFDSVLAVTKMAADLGISSSGVRQIAAAVGSGEKQVITTTVITLRRVCLLLGMFGAIMLFLARVPISQFAFGSAARASEIGWLSIVPLLCGIAGGQGALLQGVRRIGDLAKLSIFGAIASAVCSIPIVILWGSAGIPAYMIVTAGVSLIISWVYARRVHVEPLGVSLRDSAREAVNLLKLGLVFASSGMMAVGVLFLLRVLVTRQEGVEGAGQFQAASALSIVYVGFVLQAMGKDFYPRLTMVASDDQRCNQLVNEQAEISILLALPGVLVTLALAPWVIHIFYSSRFDVAADILCWQVTGMLLRVNSWPMGFIILAKGRGAIMFLTDLAAYSFYACLGWLGLKYLGLPGTGMAFLGLYIFHWCLTYCVVRRVSGFRWSPQNSRLSLIAVTVTALTLSARFVLAEPWATIVGCSLAALAGLFSLKLLVQLVGADKMNRRLRKYRLPFQFPELEPRTPKAEPSAVA